jgi:hypothetical protein
MYEASHELLKAKEIGTTDEDAIFAGKAPLRFKVAKCAH